MSSVENPEVIQPVEAVEAAHVASGVEAYICGDEGWRSTCFRELGETAGFAAIGGVLLNASYSAVVATSESSVTTTGAAVATGIGVLGYGALGLFRTHLARQRETNLIGDDGELNYFVLAGRRLPRDRE